MTYPPNAYGQPNQPYQQPYQPMGPAKQPLSIWITVLVTFFFGLFGLIPTVIGENQARQVGAPTGKHWKAFGLTILASLLLALLFFMLLGGLAAMAPSSTTGV